MPSRNEHSAIVLSIDRTREAQHGSHAAVTRQPQGRAGVGAARRAPLRTEVTADPTEMRDRNANPQIAAAEAILRGRQETGRGVCSGVFLWSVWHASSRLQIAWQIAPCLRCCCDVPASLMSDSP